MPDMHGYSIFRTDRIRFPDRLINIARRKYRSDIVHQQRQNLIFNRRQRYRYAVQRCRTRLDIQRNTSDRQEIGIVRLCRTEPQALERIVALHCTTPTLLCRLFAARMMERGRGRILIMSSITAWTPYPTISHYAATKAYLSSFAQSLWYELRGTGVSLTTVFPSAVDTPFYDLKAEHRRWLLRLGLMLSAEEVARKALRAMFRGRRRLLPGVWTKVEAALCACLPAWALLPVLKLPAVRRILERV